MKPGLLLLRTACVEPHLTAELSQASAVQRGALRAIKKAMKPWS